MKHDLEKIVRHFDIAGEFLEANPIPSGHINDTYASSFGAARGVDRYIHQRINHSVFTEPVKLMQNIERVTAHLRRKIVERNGDPGRETLTLVPTVDGASFHRTNDGNYWRTYVFIAGARTYDTAENLDHVYNASRAFGVFQELLSDFPSEELHQTIRDFHHTWRRFEAFLEAVERDTCNRARQVATEIAFVEERADDSSVLVDLAAQGMLPVRVTHNDTKFNNVMIDDETGEGICVIDLDTVMPGLSLYDFGDSVRTGANPAAEDELDLSKVTIDLGMFERIAHGYLDATRDSLLPTEVDHMVFSAKLLTFECGLRFLTDYLNGDSYFKIHREHHNLDRCRTQFKMAAEIERKTDRMERIVESLR